MYVNIAKSTTTTDRENDCSAEKAKRVIKRTLFSSDDDLGVLVNLGQDKDEEECMLQQQSESNLNRDMFDKTVLEAELKECRKFCKVGVERMTKSDNLESILGENTFDTFATNVRDNCPVLTDIIETLAIGKWSQYNKGKKTESYKFKTALQMILALDDIKSQRTTTEFSTLFGLLLISHGAGKAVIQALEPFGLCKSYAF